MESRERSVAVSAPINIAIVKYWGKRREDLNLPLNSSLSATLSQDHLKTTTKMKTSPTFSEDEVWLNGEKQDVQESKRLTACLTEIRRLAEKGVSGFPAANPLCSQKVQVHSENNFPTAAGLASSASGYAALTFGLGTLFGIQGDLTAIARQGSGSACRSLHGGFVEWRKGVREDGKDSIGSQVASEHHWPELRVFVLVVEDARKKVGSTKGMQSTARTSELLTHRVENVVENNIRLAKEAILKKDFATLGEVVMRESNQLHAVCLDTYPPLHYLHDVSYSIISLVHAYNKAAGSLRAAYTFDAGPNAFIFTTDEYASELAWLIAKFFPAGKDGGCSFFRGLDIAATEPSGDLLKKLDAEPGDSGLLKYVICTCLGAGPRIVSPLVIG